MENDQTVMLDQAQGPVVKSWGLSPKIRRMVLLGLAVLVLAGGAWVLSGKMIHDRSVHLIEQEHEVAVSTAATVSANIRTTLAYMRGIPKVLANQSEVELALAEMGPGVGRMPAHQLLQFRAFLDKAPSMVRLRKRLETILADLDAEQMLVINASGDCIASAGFPAEASPVGLNVSDRQYFQLAKREGVGRQFAISRSTGLPGIYYSAAVRANGKFVGVAVVRIDVAKLSVVDKNTFIADENGVIILSGDDQYFLKALPGSKVDELSSVELERLYQRSRIESLGMQNVVVNGVYLITLEGREAPMYKAVVHDPTDLLTLRVFRDVSELWRIRDEGKWLFVHLLLLGTVIIAGVLVQRAYLRRVKEHQTEIARANAELQKLNEELSLQARVDALTGCGNRRLFFDEINVELQRAARFTIPCCLAFLDIDFFKLTNDRYGHAAGDALLTHFSETVRKCLRSSDLLCRIGGEEFALLLRQTALDGGTQLAERVRKAVEASSLNFEATEIKITVSIGIAQWTGREESVEAFIARADNAMYDAKHAGRNQVAIAPHGNASTGPA
jgi:diguanylate cyclase (GGDEF)-like protein